jgi:hypothetical protein
MRTEYADRIATNSAPTPQEVAFGMYAENLEPQVREATFTMRDKGYHTRASGFFGSPVSWRIIGIEGEDVPHGTYEATYDEAHERAQIMSFSQNFELDAATLERLDELGAAAIRDPGDGLICLIGFVPETPDISQITETWNAIASTLPDTGTPVPDAQTFRSGFDDWGASY